jgi:hypothetical protein
VEGGAHCRMIPPPACLESVEANAGVWGPVSLAMAISLQIHDTACYLGSWERVLKNCSVPPCNFPRGTRHFLLILPQDRSRQSKSPTLALYRVTNHVPPSHPDIRVVRTHQTVERCDMQKANKQMRWHLSETRT